MATNMQEIIAYSVRDRRKALGMSQRELAEAVGFGSHQIVSELERGQRDVKAWELARIADALAHLPGRDVCIGTHQSARSAQS